MVMCRILSVMYILRFIYRCDTKNLLLNKLYPNNVDYVNQSPTDHFLYEVNVPELARPVPVFILLTGYLWPTVFVSVSAQTCFLPPFPPVRLVVVVIALLLEDVGV